MIARLHPTRETNFNEEQQQGAQNGPILSKQAKEQMNKSVENTKENFAGIRTGRANPALLNGIVVDYYGAPTPLKPYASIGVPEPAPFRSPRSTCPRPARSEKALRDLDVSSRQPNRD